MSRLVGRLAILALLLCHALGAGALASESTPSITPEAFVSKIMAIAKHDDLADTKFVEETMDVTFESIPVDRPDLGIVANRFLPKSNLRFLLSPEIFYYRVAKPARGQQTPATLQLSLNRKALCVRKKHMEDTFGRAESTIPMSTVSKGQSTHPKVTNYQFRAKNNLSVSFYFGGRFCLGAISMMQNQR